ARAGPTPGIWCRWSMTNTASKPDDSAVAATSTSFAKSASGATPPTSKLGIWRPRRTGTRIPATPPADVGHETDGRTRADGTSPLRPARLADASRAGHARGDARPECRRRRLGHLVPEPDSPARQRG